MRILGQKVSGNSIRNFGKKVMNNASVIGRKFVNTVDKLAPLASIAATAAGHPEVGMAIQSGQALVHGIDDSVRAGVTAVNSKQQDYDKNLVNFGESIDNLKEKSNALLRQN